MTTTAHIPTPLPAYVRKVSIHTLAEQLGTDLHRITELTNAGVLHPRLSVDPTDGSVVYPWPESRDAYYRALQEEAFRTSTRGPAPTDTIPVLQDHLGHMGRIDGDLLVTIEMAAGLLGSSVREIKLAMAEHPEAAFVELQHVAAPGRMLFRWRSIFQLWVRRHDEELRMRLADAAAGGDRGRRSPALREELCEAFGITVIHLELTGSWCAVAQRDGTKHELVWPTRAGAEDAMLDRLGAPKVGEVRRG